MMKPTVWDMEGYFNALSDGLKPENPVSPNKKPDTAVAVSGFGCGREMPHGIGQINQALPCWFC
ncbi:hypothetical protein [Neisseria weaveri]|uniref:hypothetical protein n=1 Tax=Neisseria weaveri TaxID=28091 RepID=UPI000D31945D|nr:hypothetical protein [Neisseria weaveri]